MYRSILVPLDGSAAAEQALPMALSLARRFAAALTIIHVHVPTWGVYGEGGVYDALVDREIREGMQAYLNGIVQRISTGTDISLSSTVLEGLVPGAIKRHATESGVDLVVMTTQGRGPVARFWLGSVADRLVRQLTIPMLFVRPQEAEVDLTQEPKFGRMLIPLDGSQLAEQILEPATAIAAATNAEITLLRVVQQFTPDSYAPDSGRVSGLRPGLLDATAGRRSPGTEARRGLSQPTHRAIKNAFIDRRDASRFARATRDRNPRRRFHPRRRSNCSGHARSRRSKAIARWKCG